MRLLPLLLLLPTALLASPWAVAPVGTPPDACTLSATNPAGQSFTLLKDGLSAPLVEWARDPATPPGPAAAQAATLTFDVDYDRFAFDGTDDGNRLSATLLDPAEFDKLQEAMAAATALAIVDAAGEALGTFPLDGSRAALARFDACWRGL